jgi:hypothetical protein
VIAKLPAGAHEKGGVEGGLGRFRRRWLVPVPKVASLAEFNAMLAEADAAEDGRRMPPGHHRRRGIRRRAGLLAPAAGEPFETADTLWPRVDIQPQQEGTTLITFHLIGVRPRQSRTPIEARVGSPPPPPKGSDRRADLDAADAAALPQTIQHDLQAAGRFTTRSSPRPPRS